MPILQCTNSIVGTVGVVPNFVFINTDDTPAEVVVTGYLNGVVQDGLLSISENDLALVKTTTGVLWMQVVITGHAPNLIYSLATPANSGGAIFEGNVQAGSNGVAGAFLSYPATAAKGHLVLAATANTGDTLVTITNAAMAAVRTFTIPDPGVTAANFLLTQCATTQTIATGNLVVAAGNLQAGASGAAGIVSSFPATAARGSLRLVAVANTGDTLTTISNAAMGQASVVSIPDPGAATSTFLLANSAGTQTIATGNLALSVGTLTLGSSGNASSLTIFPATAANGTLIISATNAGGAFNTTITNAASVGQSQVISVPDVGAATGQFNVVTGALTNGNLMMASGTAGKLADSTIAASSVQLKTEIKAGITADIGGAGAGPISVVVASLTSASPIVATIASSSNAVSVAKCIGTATGFDITFSGDPGAACVVNYVAFVAAQ